MRIKPHGDTSQVDHLTYTHGSEAHRIRKRHTLRDGNT